MAGRIQRHQLEFTDIYDAVKVSERAARNDHRLHEHYVSAKRAKGQTPSKKMRQRASSERPFIAWDGEGYNDADGTHHYMLFGSSTGDGISGASLSTTQCFDLMLSVEQSCPEAYHVWFSGNYDVNMMLRDLSMEALTELKMFGKCKWNGYRIRYLKSKLFQVSRGKTTITMNDCFTFFHTSFVKACRQYLGDSTELDTVEQWKGLRKSFTLTDLEEIREYWKLELSLTVALMNRLREYLGKAGIYLHQWHGPGAVAGAILRTRGDRHVPLLPAIHDAARYAYSGGRFEPFRIGRLNGPAYQYDKRSAYPSTISTLPGLGGEWWHVDRPTEVTDFALYRVTYQATDTPVHYPHPLHWRAKNGAVFYPETTSGWYWGVELHTLPGSLVIHEAWIYGGSDARPYAWISEMYRVRAFWKSIGEPAELAMKLAMNCIYGKKAQQVGWRVLKDGTIKVPTYHQLEYAGFITAATRAAIYQVMMLDPDHVIACETDSVTFDRPVDIPLGDGLGEWELTVYDDIMYIQSGVYWALKDGEWKTRTRGFGRTAIEPAAIDAWLSTVESAELAYSMPPLTVTQNRFNTLGSSIGTPRWRTWTEETRELRPGTPGGKREHYLPDCTQCPGALNLSMHTMRVALPIRTIDYTQPSAPYPVLWIDGPSEMQLAMWENDDEWVTEDDL